MEGCSRADWWSPHRITEAIRRLNADSGDMECAWHLLSGNAYSQRPAFLVSAICIKDACPDCQEVLQALTGGNK